MTPKEKQAVELHRRVRARLMDGPDPQMALRSYEIVLGFLVCLEELQRMQAEEKAASTELTKVAR